MDSRTGTTADIAAAAAPPMISPISTLPRELLYIILAYCNQTHDVVRERRSTSGERSLYIAHGAASKSLGRVCRAWKNGIDAGMVPPATQQERLREIQLTDQHFFKLVSENQAGRRVLAIPAMITLPGFPEFPPLPAPPPLPAIAAPAAPANADTDPHKLKLAKVLGYPVLTIVCREIDDFYPTSVAAAAPRQFTTPTQLNIVIIEGRAADLRNIFLHFRTPYTSLRDTIHQRFLASRKQADPENTIRILVWHGLITLPLIPGQQPPTLRAPIALGRVDLSIKRWSDDASIPSIPWILGQLCRSSRPLIVGFHLLQPQEPASLTDRWCTQRPCTSPDNTFLREMHVSGISGDAFLRLLQCAAIEVWCVRRLHIAFPSDAHERDLCYWDYRIFDRRTWPVVTEESGKDHWDEGTDYLAFPRISLRRRVDGRVQDVVKQRMEAPCQIAAPQEVEGAGGWGAMRGRGWGCGACGMGETDVEGYVGRSLRWSSLKVVELEGNVKEEDLEEFEHLHVFQEEPSLEIVGSTGKFAKRIPQDDAQTKYPSRSPF